MCCKASFHLVVNVKVHPAGRRIVIGGVGVLGVPIKAVGMPFAISLEWDISITCRVQIFDFTYPCVKECMFKIDVYMFRTGSTRKLNVNLVIYNGSIIRAIVVSTVVEESPDRRTLVVIGFSNRN